MDMAATGTKIPNDAGKMNLIPSKPRPDQIASTADPNYVGSVGLENAADNAGDIPRVRYSKAFPPVYPSRRRKNCVSALSLFIYSPPPEPPPHSLPTLPPTALSTPPLANPHTVHPRPSPQRSPHRHRRQPPQHRRQQAPAQRPRWRTQRPHSQGPPPLRETRAPGRRR